MYMFHECMNMLYMSRDKIMLLTLIVMLFVVKFKEIWQA